MLALAIHEKARIVGFVGGLATIIAAKHPEDVENYATKMVKVGKTCLETVGLTLAEEKWNYACQKVVSATAALARSLQKSLWKFAYNRSVICVNGYTFKLLEKEGNEFVLPAHGSEDLQHF